MNPIGKAFKKLIKAKKIIEKTNKKLEFLGIRNELDYVSVLLKELTDHLAEEEVMRYK